LRASSPKALQTLSLCCWGAVCFATDLKTDGTSPPSGGAVAWSNRRSLLPGGRYVRDRKRNPRSPPLLAGEEIGAESPTPAKPGARQPRDEAGLPHPESGDFNGLRVPTTGTLKLLGW